MESLNIVDIVILLVFFSSILIGFGRGFVGEVVSLVTLIVAIFIAIHFTSPLANYFTATSTVKGVVSQTSSAIGVSTSEPVSYIALAISFGLIFFGTMLLGGIVKLILNSIFQTGVLGLGNRLLGAMFGTVRGFFINLVLIFLIQLSPFGNSSWFAQSQFVQKYQPYVQWLANYVSPTLNNLRGKINQALQDANSSIQSTASQISSSLQ